MPKLASWIQEVSFPVDFPPTDRIFVPEMKQRWTKRAAIDPNRSALRSRLRRGLPYIVYRLIFRLEPKAPKVTVRIVEPEAHVRRAGPFRSDFIARIFQISLDALQVIECFSQRRHVRQMKRHVIDRFRRRLAFE